MSCDRLGMAGRVLVGRRHAASPPLLATIPACADSSRGESSAGRFSVSVPHLVFVKAASRAPKPDSCLTSSRRGVPMEPEMLLLPALAARAAGIRRQGATEGKACGVDPRPFRYLCGERHCCSVERTGEILCEQGDANKEQAPSRPGELRQASRCPDVRRRATRRRPVASAISVQSDSQDARTTAAA
jgi:hypothetical protein